MSFRSDEAGSPVMDVSRAGVGLGGPLRGPAVSRADAFNLPYGVAYGMPGASLAAPPGESARVRRRLSRGARWRGLLAVALATAGLAVSPGTASASFDVVEATIPDLMSAYRNRVTTSEQVVRTYLGRIAEFDSGGPRINSIADLNPDALDDARRIDRLRTNGVNLGPLMGVPVVVKNSYDVKGMVTTNGVGVLRLGSNGGVTNMVAPKDSFAVQQLRDAGAIILGKASLSTMAFSYNGFDDAQGRVLNPYVPLRTPGGSSSGSGSSIAANLAMLSMGGETGGSIRVPSTHNALVGLKTSNGLISPEGTWPLTPSRDVVGPMAKSVADVAYAMDALVGPSPGNLWNNTPFYPAAGPQPGTVRPTRYTDFLNENALRGKTVAIPKTYVGKGKFLWDGLGTAPPAGTHPYLDYSIDPQVEAAFERAKQVLIAQGATLVEVDIPAYDLYNSTIERRATPTVTGFPFDYPSTTVTSGGTTRQAPDNTWSNWASAFYYNELIESYNDPVIRNLRDLANALADSPTLGTSPTERPDWLFPALRADGSFPPDYTGAVNFIRTRANILEAGNAVGFGDADGDGVKDNPDAIRALQAFADLRREFLEDFMDRPAAFADPNNPDDPLRSLGKIDVFSFPTLSYLAPLQRGILVPNNAVDPANPLNRSYLSLNARFEANILGLPGITVPMGYSEEGAPMGLEFMGKFLKDHELIAYAYDYEQATGFRRAPDMAAIPEPSGLLVLGGMTLVLIRREDRSPVPA